MSTAKHIPLSIAQPVMSAQEALSHSGGGIGSLYIHIPFCYHKCHYCDFYSLVDTQDRQEPFTAALILELETLADHSARECEGGLRTIFAGGGTPSLLELRHWERILATLHDRYRFGADLEFTVECNPETVTPELMKLFSSGGVNRVSMGAQSFEARHLKALERWHDPASVERALGAAAEAGINRRSIDLIYGVPAQSLDECRQDLECALGLLDGTAIEHISSYSLTYEPNTAMTARLQRGEFEPIPEDLDADMYESTVAVLRSRGFERYEVSNHARPGAQCRHNLAYWRQEQWLAAGPSASAHVAGQRWKNVPRLGDWMHSVCATGGFSAVIDYESADERRALSEKLMMGLRLAEGVAIDAIQRAARPIGAETALERIACRHIERGVLIAESGRWRLNDRGFLLADAIAAEFMRAVSSA